LETNRVQKEPENGEIGRQQLRKAYDTIQRWWENEKSVNIPNEDTGEEKYYSGKSAIEACINTIRSNKRRIKALEDSVRDHEFRLTEIADDLGLEIKRLKEEISSIKKLLPMQQTPKLSYSSIRSEMNTQQSIVSSPSDQVVDAFNEWAKNPKSSLPSQFCYAEGELRLREKQDIKRSYDDNALWIVNKTGSPEYLFPNPNVIDQIGGDIDVLYSVTGIRRAKGQNKVYVQKACVIMDEGWIEYKGLLSII
jgi:hypothetical protein